MSQADLPMMPFWVKDWVSATLHWPAAERGAYISLLAFQWTNRVLPAHEEQLARITGLELADFRKVWQTLGPKFDSDERGLFNKRLEQVRKEALRLRDARALGATLANQKRRAKRTALREAANDADFNAEHDAEHDAEVTHPNPNTNSVEEKKTRKIAARAERRAQRVSRETWIDDPADENWIKIKLTAPRRVGSQPWQRGLKAYAARRAEGYSAEVLLAGCERWARYVTETHQDPRYVMQVATFFGPEKHFLADWEVPPPAANDERWSPTSDDIEEPPDGYAA